jgi:hypothetical protein
MKMAESKHRIRMITGWTGKIDGKERTVKPDEVVDVDDATCRALVYQYLKAELVPLDEIIAEAKKTPKHRTGQRASKKAPKKPTKDKQQVAASVK